MKKRINLLLCASFVFVFAFAMFVTVQAEAAHDCTKTPCEPFDCCYNDNSAARCENTWGVWYNGLCNCGWTGDNPNECQITGCYPLKCW